MCKDYSVIVPAGRKTLNDQLYDLARSSVESSCVSASVHAWMCVLVYVPNDHLCSMCSNVCVHICIY